MSVTDRLRRCIGVTSLGNRFLRTPPMLDDLQRVLDFIDHVQPNTEDGYYDIALRVIDGLKKLDGGNRG